MATIRIHDEANTTIENQEEVASFLDSQEVIYEQWDITKLPEHLSEKYDLTEEEKQQILDTSKLKLKISQPAAAIKHRMLFHCQTAIRNLMNCLKTLKESITIQTMRFVLL